MVLQPPWEFLRQLLQKLFHNYIIYSYNQVLIISLTVLLRNYPFLKLFPEFSRNALLVSSVHVILTYLCSISHSSKKAESENLIGELTNFKPFSFLFVMEGFLQPITLKFGLKSFPSKLHYATKFQAKIVNNTDF